MQWRTYLLRNILLNIHLEMQYQYNLDITEKKI